MKIFCDTVPPAPSVSICSVAYGWRPSGRIACSNLRRRLMYINDLPQGRAMSPGIRGGTDGKHAVRKGTSIDGRRAARCRRARRREALDMLAELAGDPELRLDMNFMPGDTQFLHNHTILHARSAYEDWPEVERKQHLLRLWLSRKPQPQNFSDLAHRQSFGWHPSPAAGKGTSLPSVENCRRRRPLHPHLT